MNIEKLREAESSFLTQYPGGFSNPQILAIAKKHQMEKTVQFAQTAFAKPCFENIGQIIENWVRLISRSSMVSVFEKPKFRDYVFGLPVPEQERLAMGLYQRLHGHSQKGFEQICAILAPGKLAKWSLVSVCPAYVDPRYEVFMKPTTVKGVVSHFELSTMAYSATPTWKFYCAYRDAINEMKTQVDAQLSPSNAAFSGFLMMSLGLF